MKPKLVLILAVTLMMLTGAAVGGFLLKTDTVISVYIPGKDTIRTVNLGGKSDSPDVINVIVKGSIYEKNTRVSMFAACFNNLNHPIQTNATVTLTFPNGTIFEDTRNMSEIFVGSFEYNTTSPNVTGTYFSLVNCTDGTNYGLAFGEFQNSPSWVEKLADLFTTQQQSFNTELEVITSFPSEEFRIELTFTYPNNSVVQSIDTITVVITDPNDNIHSTLTLADFTQNVNTWQSDVSTPSSFTNGLYRFHANATVGNQTSISKTKQARLTSGAVFRYVLSSQLLCNDNTNTITTLNLITNEGGATTETTCTNWLDFNNDGVIDPDEPQAGFSKQVQPSQNITETTVIQTGDSSQVTTLRGVCTYTDPNQPNATASTSVNLLSCGTGPGVAPGGGGGGPTTTALPSITEVSIVRPILNILGIDAPEGVENILDIILIILIILVVLMLALPQKIVVGFLTNPLILLIILAALAIFFIKNLVGG